MSVYRVGSNKSSVNNFPSIRPTLDLDFANSKTLDPRITFTRASGGSYVGADGLIKYAGINEARFDHDPVTGESLGLLVEETRSNLIQRSEEFDTANWIKNNSTSINSNFIVSPDGIQTADKLIENTTTTQKFINQPRDGSNETLTFSVFCKAAERTQVFLQMSNFLNAAVGVLYDLKLGVVLSITGGETDYTASSASIIPYPNGWYRCILTTTKGGLVNNTNRPTISISRNQAISYQGDGTSGIYIWGAQLEQGSFPTSYIPTQGSTRTRAADNASITGKNFSEWYRQDEGTFTVKYRADNPINGQNQFLARASNNTYSNAVGVFITDEGKSSLSVTKNGLFDGLVGNSVVLQKNISYTTSATYKFNNLAISLNGQSVFNDNSATIPDDLNRLDIGRDHTGAVVNGLDAGKIFRLTYFPKRLPNSQLQALTR